MCYDCYIDAINPFHSGYSCNCLDCAARAYRDAPSNKREQELDYYTRHGKTFCRSDILERVEAMK